jgi:hypothetical protein
MTDPMIERFKEYISEQQKKLSFSTTNTVEPETPDEEIPYINYKDNGLPKEKKEQKIITKEEYDLPHERLPNLSWRDHNDNIHLGKDSKSITSTLKKSVPKLTSEYKRAVTDYTGKTGDQVSGDLNHNLLKPKIPMHWRSHAWAKSLHKAVSHPIGHDVHLYSGVHSDPRNWEKSDDGSTHLRAFTSMTHDKKIAHVFGHQWTEGKKASTSGKKGAVHIIHLHAKADDHGLHATQHSTYDEHETILPAGTHIKPHPDYKGPEVYIASDGTKVYVHHYVISKQEHPDHYKPANKIY